MGTGRGLNETAGQGEKGGGGGMVEIRSVHGSQANFVSTLDPYHSVVPTAGRNMQEFYVWSGWALSGCRHSY